MYSTREQIKMVQANHKISLKNLVIYNEKRDALVHQILNNKTPRWGGVSIKLVSW